jgi:hypothetical protein
MEKGLMAGDDYWDAIIAERNQMEYSELVLVASELILKIVKAFISLHAGKYFNISIYTYFYHIIALKKIEKRSQQKCEFNTVS